MHHDHDFAVNRNGTRDIFMNTPNQAAWFERYLTDWTGPKRPPRAHAVPHEGLGLPRRHHGAGRRGRVRSTSTTPAAAGSTVDVTLTRRRARSCTECAARIAIPTGPDDNPWDRRGERWQP